MLYIYNVSQNVITMHGARIGFFSGDVKKLAEDIAVLKPTLFATVPRILNRIHNKVGCMNCFLILLNSLKAAFI